MNIRAPFVAPLLAILLSGCVATANAAYPADNRQVRTAAKPSVESDLHAVLTRHAVPAAAVGLLEANVLALESYAGTERPGVRVDNETRFEIASVTKTVVAETALRLVEQGLLDLDEPLAEYWIDPDVADDPRLHTLTARNVLTHRTGFPNWRFFRSDRKLAFESAPGERFGYSGEGFDYLGHAIAEKLGKPFPEVVDEQLFAPLGIGNAVIQNIALDTHFAKLRDAEGKQFEKHCRPGFCFSEGGWSAAGGLAITLRGYARVLAAISSSTGYSPALTEMRDTVVSTGGEAQVVSCEEHPDAQCPLEQGYGLGMQIVRYPDRTLIGHTGGDWSTLSVAYTDPATGKGVIVFLTGPIEQTAPAMVDILETIDPRSPYLPLFRSRVEEAG
jgi:CubicO group peptidase (beta-lactamase class C family)